MCSCDNVNGIYCDAHKSKARKEPHARKHKFKNSDLAFYIERLQVLLDVINLDVAGNLEGVADAQDQLQSIWDFCRTGMYSSAQGRVEWFYGYVWVIPKSHRNSYKNYLTELNNAL